MGNWKTIKPSQLLVKPSQLLVEPSQLLVEPSQLLVKPSQLLVAPSQLLVEPSQLLVEPSQLLALCKKYLQAFEFVTHIDKDEAHIEVDEPTEIDGSVAKNSTDTRGKHGWGRVCTVPKGRSIAFGRVDIEHLEGQIQSLVDKAAGWAA